MRLALALLLAGCGKSVEQFDAERTRDVWNEICTDTATLLATTSGNPTGHTCRNKAHRMRVQVATHASNEEAAALVFCECHRGDGGQ